MQIELKNVKVAAFASHETDCFEASLYVEGKRVAAVSNDGQGGPNLYHWTDRKAEARLVAHCKALPPVELGHGMGTVAVDLDILVGDLLTEYETLKQYKRWCKTKTVFRLVGDEAGRFRTLTIPYGPQAKAYLATKYAGRVEVIVNEQIA